MPADLSAYDAIAVGPGLGTGAEAQRMLDAVVASAAQLVVDADALTLLAERPRKSDDWILTPHPGEAARLLGTSVDDVQRDRLGSVRGIVERFGGTCVLKGANTLVCGASRRALGLRPRQSRHGDGRQRRRADRRHRRVAGDDA